MTTVHERAADVLRRARALHEPCEPIRNLFDGTGTVTDGYTIQQVNTKLALADGRRPIGWKIGLTSGAVQTQLGVNQPDFAPLFADQAMNDGLSIPMTALLQPRVEAEIAFVLCEDLGVAPVTSVDVIRATEFVLPAIEIVDSRIRGWDISIVDTVADDASSGLFVVGSKPTMLSAVDLNAVVMSMECDEGVVSEGAGANCLGSPVNAVAWLANTLLSFGERLREGEVVLSGALGPMVPVRPGAAYEASLGDLGRVRALFD